MKSLRQSGSGSAGLKLQRRRKADSVVSSPAYLSFFLPSGFRLGTLTLNVPNPEFFVVIRLLSNSVGIPPLLTNGLLKACGIFAYLFSDLLGSVGIVTPSLECPTSLVYFFFFLKYRNNHDPQFWGILPTVEARRPVLQVCDDARTHTRSSCKGSGWRRSCVS